MDLREATKQLLHAHDVGVWLKRADNYMQAYNRMPQDFILPREHVILKPIVEAFAADTAAFVEYIKAMRDGTSGSAYEDLHNLYRTVSLRVLQGERRVRMRKAVTLLTPELEAALGREVTYQEQVVVADWIEKLWGAARVALLDRERNALKSKKLSTEERAAVLDAYWTSIDKKLDKGEVPLFGEQLRELIETLEVKK